MNLQEKLATLSKEEVIEAAIALAKYAKLDTETDLEGCGGQTGCGTCVANVWVPCS